MSRKVEMVRMAPDESFTAAPDRERSAAEVFANATKFQKVDKATVDKALGVPQPSHSGWPTEWVNALIEDSSAAAACETMVMHDMYLVVSAEGKTTKFLSEAELQKNRELHGGSLEDGTFAGRTLTQAILAQREEKEQKFQDDWKTMKQGTCSKRHLAHLQLKQALGQG